jgi:3-phenylpropionate/cinnamic acid dioxygenase small subunit
VAGLDDTDRRAIEEIKYRYLRAVDTKDWDLLASTLADDVEAGWAGGAFTASGRDGVVQTLRSWMGSPSMHTSHRCTHPELTADGPDRARGVWALNDVVIDDEQRFVLTGSGFYEDRYVRADDGWRIAETRYDRGYELLQPWPEGAALTGSMWRTEGRSTLRPDGF